MRSTYAKKIVYINGRFLTQPVTGVQRVAEETIKAIDNLISKGEINEYKFIILAPKKDVRHLDLKNIKIKRFGALTGHLWEQLELPLFSRKKLLINFCNTAPLVKKNQIIYIHDAAIIDEPAGFTSNFVRYYSLLYKVLSVRSKRIITVSNFSKGRLEQYFPFVRDKISVSYLGTDHIANYPILNGYLEKNSLISNNYFLAVSSANPNKNFKIISDVLIGEKGNGDYTFVIVGGKSSKVFRAEKLKNEHSIKYLGYVSDEELVTLYKHAKAFIFPSKYEGFGLPPLEAMYMGTPVIASKSASIPEILESNALYFKYDDINELKSNLDVISHDTQLVDRLKKDGKEHSNQFKWSSTALHLCQKIREFY